MPFQPAHRKSPTYPLTKHFFCCTAVDKTYSEEVYVMRIVRSKIKTMVACLVAVGIIGLAGQNGSSTAFAQGGQYWHIYAGSACGSYNGTAVVLSAAIGMWNSINGARSHMAHNVSGCSQCQPS